MEVWISPARAEAAIRAGVRALIRDAVLTFLVIAALLCVLARCIIGQPLKQLTAFARSLGDGDLAAPIALRSSNELGRLASTLDTTRQKLLRSEEHLIAAREAAEAANQAKGNFLANMSHETRTPLTAILGFGDLLHAGELEGDASEDALRVIHCNGQHLLSLVNDLLDLSKVDSGGFAVESVPCSPAALLADVEKLMSVQARDAGVTLVFEHSDELPAVVGTDPTRVRQVLINLVGNALKFSPGGAVRVESSFTSVDGSGQLQFDVVDSGIGMTQEQIDRVFRPFTQADESTTRKFGGTGLGLTISQKLAQALGGDVVVVASSQASGTRFRVTIVAEVCEGVELTASDVSDAVPVTQLRGRVLLAEDGRDNQALICHILRRAGAEVWTVENGRLAVDRVLEAEHAGEPFDVILMDVNMPVMDGFEATRVLREHDYRGPVVMVTAGATAENRERGLAAGCNDFLTKPIQRQRMLSVLAEFLPAPIQAG